MLGAIAEGTTTVRGFLASEDCLATQAALEAMGVAIERRRRRRSSASTASGRTGCAAPSKMLDLGNSGTAIRLLMGLLAGQPFDSTLTGDASLRQRPMERVAAPLRQMGAQHRDGRRRAAARRDRRRRALARHRLRVADGERAGEVGAVARRARPRAARRRCARRARAATTPSACSRAWACGSAVRPTARGTRSRWPGPPRCAAARCACPRISARRRSSSSPAASRRATA